MLFFENYFYKRALSLLKKTDLPTSPTIAATYPQNLILVILEYSLNDVTLKNPELRTSPFLGAFDL